MARRPDPKKRELILNSAVELFLEYGYRDTTVAQIAGNVGLMASNTYIYFKNKEAILRVVVEQMMNEHTAFFSELSEKSVGLNEQDFVDLCFNELEKIRPRILFIMKCYLIPGLTHIFDDIDLDYSQAFKPYFAGWPEEHAVSTTRALMALSDSYYLVGDMDSVKKAAVTLLKNAKNAL